MDEFIKIIFNSSGAAGVALIAFYFGNKAQRMFLESIKHINDEFNVTIKDYLIDSNKIKQTLAMKLQEFSNAMNQQSETIKEQTSVIHKMYQELYKKRGIIKKYENK